MTSLVFRARELEHVSEMFYSNERSVDMQTWLFY